MRFDSQSEHAALELRSATDRSERCDVRFSSSGFRPCCVAPRGARSDVGPSRLSTAPFCRFADRSWSILKQSDVSRKRVPHVFSGHTRIAMADARDQFRAKLSAGGSSELNRVHPLRVQSAAGLPSRSSRVEGDSPPSPPSGFGGAAFACNRERRLASPRRTGRVVTLELRRAA